MRNSEASYSVTEVLQFEDVKFWTVRLQRFATIRNKTENVHKNTEALSDLCTLGSSQKVIKFSPLGLHFVIVTVVVVLVVVHKCYYRFYGLLHFFQWVKYVNIFLNLFIIYYLNVSAWRNVFCITDNISYIIYRHIHNLYTD
jgi:hypothetical protein